MPGVKKYTLLRLHEALQLYTEKTGRRPTYEYAMIEGVNDTNPEMQALCDFCEGTLYHVNLIQLNDIEGSPPSRRRFIRLRIFSVVLSPVASRLRFVTPVVTILTPLADS